MKNESVKLGLSLLGLFLCLGLFSCSRKSAYRTYEGVVFHTYFRVVYQSDEDLKDRIDEALELVNRSANPFDSTSLLYALNNNKTDRVDPMVKELWNTAYKVWELSEGSYDVTISPLVNAWGFGFEPPLPITAQKIDSLKQWVGMDKVKIEEDRLTKATPEMQIDFASIAKGYASDRVGEALLRAGVQNFLVEIGGEIAYRGKNPQNQSWRVAVNAPLIDSLAEVQQIAEVIYLREASGGIATSGNYRNYKKDPQTGKIFGHTISPKTGYPITTDILSATVLAPQCVWADAWATAFMTMSSDQVLQLKPRLPEGVEFLLIVSDDKVQPNGWRMVASFPLE